MVRKRPGMENMFESDEESAQKITEGMIALSNICNKLSFNDVDIAKVVAYNLRFIHPTLQQSMGRLLISIIKQIGIDSKQGLIYSEDARNKEFIEWCKFMADQEFYLPLI